MGHTYESWQWLQHRGEETKPTARDDATKATVAFARDTDDPIAALATMRQVLAEAERTRVAENAMAQLLWGQSLEGQAYGQVLTVAHGLAALVERVIEQPVGSSRTVEEVHRAFRSTLVASALPGRSEGPLVANGGYLSPHHETAGDPEDYCICGADPWGGDAECFCTAPPSDVIEHELTVADVDDEGYEVPASRYHCGDHDEG